VEPVKYVGCVYTGGIDKMKKSDRAVLIFEKSQISLHRGRTFMGLRRVWARWSAVTELSLEEGEDTTKFVFSTKTRGPGVVLIPDVEPAEVWEALYRIKGARELVPEDLREEFASTIVLEDEDEEDDEEAPAGEGGDDGADADADRTDEPTDETPAEAPADTPEDSRPEEATTEDASPEDESPEDAKAGTETEAEADS
jgi:hypothetical protein